MPESVPASHMLKIRVGTAKTQPVLKMLVDRTTRGLSGKTANTAKHTTHITPRTKFWTEFILVLKFMFLLLTFT
jgi:hypothetical protein